LQRRASSGDPLHAGDLEDAAASGDEAATAVLDGAAMALVVGLRCVAAAYDPDRVVLGGGLLQAGSYLLNKLQAGWAEKRSAWTSPEVTLARHGEDAGLLGAALLWAPRGDEPADVVAGGEPDR
jgi:glucokinase